MSSAEHEEQHVPVRLFASGEEAVIEQLPGKSPLIDELRAHQALMAEAERERVAGAEYGQSADVSQQHARSAVLASQNGSRYYFPHCSGVTRINPENIIGFVSAAEAEAAGLTLAANCTE